VTLYPSDFPAQKWLLFLVLPGLNALMQGKGGEEAVEHVHLFQESKGHLIVYRSAL